MQKYENISINKGKKISYPPVADPPPLTFKERTEKNRKNQPLSPAPLDTYANKVATAKNQRVAGRVNINRLRHTGSDLIGGRLKHCGCTPVHLATPSISKTAEGNYHYSGLQSCGSVWICPVCSLKISKQRQVEVFQIMKKELATPGIVSGFLTLTVGHSNEDRLEYVMSKVTDTWKSIQQSRKYRRLAEKYGHQGDIRTLEIKVSFINGWHPHLHIAMFGKCNQEQLAEFGSEIISMWLWKMKGKAGAIGQRYKPIYNDAGISEYITKWDCSSEMTLSNMKVDKECRDNYTVFDLLTGVAMGNDATGWKKKMYIEYAGATKGKRQLTFSKELKRLHTEAGAKTDEEIVKEEQGSTEVLKIDVPVWSAITYHRLQAHVINAMEYEGLPEVQMLLMEFGIFTTYQEKNNIITLDD